jgi:competence protein ComEC
MKRLLYLGLVFVFLFACINVAEKAIEQGEVKKPVDVTNIVPKEDTTTTTPKTEENKTVQASDNLKIYFIEVNSDETEGDAILIQKGEFNMLVDAGPESGSQKLITYLKNKGVKKIDALVTTINDKDQYGGIPALTKEFKITDLWTFSTRSAGSDYNSVIDSITADRVVYLARGVTKSYGDLKIEVLNPSLENSNPDLKLNAGAFKLTYKNMCILLTSELNAAGQKDLLNRFDIQCPILQIPDHGLGDSNRQALLFIKAIKPEYAIISGGPSSLKDEEGRGPIRQILSQNNVKLLENYVGGTIVIETNGMEYSVKYEQ